MTLLRTLRQRWRRVTTQGILRHRAARWGVALATVVGLVLCALPLVGVHGVESALALSAVLPFIAVPAATHLALAVRGAKDGARSDKARPSQSFRKRGRYRHITGVLQLAVWMAVVPILLLALNQLRIRQCDPWGGLLWMVAGPVLSVTLAVVVGACVASFRPKKPTRAALLFPLAALLWGLWEFWSTPAIYVYSHLLGWFPGTLYDVGRTFPVAYGTFRLLTLLWIGTLLAWLVAREGTIRRARYLAYAGFLLACAGQYYGTDFGHRSTAESIQARLGAHRRGEFCEIHYPRELHRDAVLRLLADCDFRVMRARRALGVTGGPPIQSYFYRSVDEKREAMGAGHTFIAKPWRNEVHLQLRAWPHPVLGHEVVHAVAAQAARGPFLVSGTLGGYFPNAMLIEGIAVALDWRLDEGLDAHQWSKAMREMGILPRAQDLQDLGFLSFDSRRAYAAAGSLTRFFYQEYGPEALRDAHRAGRFDVVVPLEELEARWHEYLDALDAPPGAQGLAELRFARSSIFERVCPHEVARLRGQLGADYAAGDDWAAQSTCEEILAIEPGALDARAALVAVASRLGHNDDAERHLAVLDGAPPQVRARAQESLADAHWRRGHRAEARRIYRALRALPQSEGERRLREVKLLGLLAGGAVEARIRRIFVEDAPRSASAAEVVDLARDLDSLREDGLGLYLVGRQLMNAGEYAGAARRFELALLRSLPTEALTLEAQRNLGACHVAVGHLRRAEEVWRRWVLHPRLGHEAREWLERIHYLRRH